MSVTTTEALQRARDANDLPAVAELEELLKYESEIDVSPYFYSQAPKPEVPALVGAMDTIREVGSGVVNPLTIGVTMGVANPMYNALTSERAITLPPGEGEKKGQKLPAPEAREQFKQVGKDLKNEFQEQKTKDISDLNDNLQGEKNALTAAQENARNKRIEFEGHKKDAYLRSQMDHGTDPGVTTVDIGNTNASGLPINPDGSVNQTQVELNKKAGVKIYTDAQNALEAADKKVTGLTEQLTDTQNKFPGQIQAIQGSTQNPAELINADVDKLKSMGLTPPDVTAELEKGDVAGARKKMSEFLDNQLKPRAAFLKDAIQYMKQNPGKAIPRALGKVGKYAVTGDTVKKGIMRGTGAGLLAQLGTSLYDTFTGDYLSQEEVDQTLKEYQDLGKLAEQFKNTSRGEGMYLNPLIPQQKQVIDQIESASKDPNKAYLLYKANE